MRRTIHPRRRIGPVNPIEETAITSRSDTRSETTSTSREERRPGRGSLMWSRPIPSPWHVYKDELMKLDLQRVSFIEEAKRMLNGATLSVSRLYSITGVDWLIAASINFSSTTALRFADLEGLPFNNTMGPVNARPLQDVRLNHDEGNREERPGRFLTTRAPIGQHVKMFRQLKTPPGHVKERIYPKLVNQDGDVQRYGGLKAIKKDETIFAAYDKAEMRKAKIMIVANSEFVYTSKSLFWPDGIMLAAVDLDLPQLVSLAIGVQRQTVMNPITIVFAGINDHLYSRGFLSRLRDPTTAENAVWPAIKDILESMGEVVDATKEGSFTKVTPRVVFALSPGYAHLPDGLKFVYAIVTLLSETKYDVIISAPNRMIEMENLRPLRAELPADQQRGSTVTDYNTVDENNEVHRVMMEVEPLLEASGKRNWRSIMFTHDEFPSHCLLQTWWYPKRSNLVLIWDSGELLSMGIPDSSQPITIVIGVMMAIRWLEAHMKENNRQEAPTREQLRKLDFWKDLDLFETMCKILNIPVEVKKIWTRRRLMPWFRANMTAWLYEYAKNDMSKHGRVYSEYQLDIGAGAFKRALVTHRNAVTTAVKRISRTSERSGKEKAEMLKEDLERNVTLCLRNNFCRNRKSNVDPLPSCKQRVEEQKCWRTASNSVRIAKDVLQDTEIESAESISQEEEMEH